MLWLWHRLLADFWPLDNSRVGPNLVASVVTAALVIAHNEWRILRADERRHAGLRQVLRDLVREAEHPVDVAEQRIAEDVRAGNA